MADRPYQAPQPPIGLPVLWYRHANEQESPWAATIVEVSSTGMVSLVAFNPSGTMFIRRGVRHTSDPALKQGDVRVRSERGSWAYIRNCSALRVDCTPSPPEKPAPKKSAVETVKAE